MRFDPLIYNLFHSAETTEPGILVNIPIFKKKKNYDILEAFIIDDQIVPEGRYQNQV